MNNPAGQAEKGMHFIAEEISVLFAVLPAREKTPPCPKAFTWRGKTFQITGLISEWHDFTRRGRMARNMQPAHASLAARRGSLGVGRFHFQVQTNANRAFEIYYDRSIKSVDDRLGHWYLYREIPVEGTPAASPPTDSSVD